MFSDLFFTKDFHRGFNHLIENDITPVYNYEFKYDGKLNICKQILFAPRPIFLSLNGKNEYYYFIY